ncbi:MAG: hypothetical protein IJZ80_06275 [Clostridia bacterium]|nr:hypothetical protein [Clostridia bacterium]
MMKKIYNAPECQTVWMNNEDVLTASSPVAPTLNDSEGKFSDGIKFTW